MTFTTRIRRNYLAEAFIISYEGAEHILIDVLVYEKIFFGKKHLIEVPK